MLASWKLWSGRLPLHGWLRPRGAPAVVVLMYHDVRAEDDFANWMRVAVGDFARQLDACAEMGGFIAPAALLAPQEIPRDRLSFLVTFDDGYHNNAELAAPLLASRGIPALFCVSTGPLSDRRPFWTDIVTTPIQALRLSALDLSAHGLGRFAFRDGDDAERWDDVQRVLAAIKTLGNEDDPRIARLLGWLQTEYAEVLAQHLPRFAPLGAEQIRRMAAGGFCHFASHGHEHRILTRLADGDLARSLALSRRILVDLTGQPVDQLAYPNGDHDARVRAAAARAGYRLAYTVQPGLVAGRLDALRLPRVAVGAFDTRDLLRFKINRALLSWRRQRAGRQLELAMTERGP